MLPGNSIPAIWESASSAGADFEPYGFCPVDVSIAGCSIGHCLQGTESPCLLGAPASWHYPSIGRVPETGRTGA